MDENVPKDARAAVDPTAVIDDVAQDERRTAIVLSVAPRST
jgi:hypothetical protein